MQNKIGLGLLWGIKNTLKLKFLLFKVISYLDVKYRAKIDLPKNVYNTSFNKYSWKISVNDNVVLYCALTLLHTHTHLTHWDKSAKVTKNSLKNSVSTHT
jgi:hypothetical protein